MHVAEAGPPDADPSSPARLAAALVRVAPPDPGARRALPRDRARPARLRLVRRAARRLRQGEHGAPTCSTCSTRSASSASSWSATTGAGGSASSSASARPSASSASSRSTSRRRARSLDPRVLAEHVALLVHGGDRHARARLPPASAAPTSCERVLRGGSSARTSFTSEEIREFTEPLREPDRAARDASSSTAPSSCASSASSRASATTRSG